MAILAELYPRQRATDRRAALRRRLLLNVHGFTPHGEATAVVIHDISVNGLLLETSVDLLIGETIEVDVPENGLRDAMVMWNSGRFFGCQFDGRISPAAVSAAVLRSPFDTPPEPVVADIGLSAAYEAEEFDGAMSPMAKAWILLGLVVSTWVVIFGLVRWIG